MSLEAYSTLSIFHFFLIFSRLGAALMILPGYGEFYVSPRVRLTIALTISAAIFPLLSPNLPPVPETAGLAGLWLIKEALIGLLIGGMGRMVQSTLHTAGMFIAFQSSLGSAMLFDANQGSQGSVFGTFLTVMGVTLYFTTGLHHVMIEGIIASYVGFATGTLPETADMAQFTVETLSLCFSVAFKIASPLVVLGLLVYLSAGIMARLMPNMQVFFVILPAQVYLSFVFLLLGLSAGLLWYIDHFKERSNVLFGF